MINFFILTRHNNPLEKKRGEVGARPPPSDT
jgi:hypothetical protein